MKVLAVSGASGGHIFPAVSLLGSLNKKEAGMELILVVPKAQKIINSRPDLPFKIKYIDSPKFSRRDILKNIPAFFDLLKGCMESIFLLGEFKPDVVIGFGTVTSVSLVFFAWFFRIKTVIHEQNVIPGRANRILAKLVDKVAVSFSQSLSLFRVGSDKLVVTGNPIRPELAKIDRKDALRFFGLDDRFTILVVGGSQGSRSINKAFMDFMANSKERPEIQIIHITGKEEAGVTEDFYRSLGLKAKVFAFLDQMQYAYSSCDLVLSRGGATTIAELMHFSLPAVIIPYPFAYAHQTANAKVLEQAGTAVVVDEKSISSGKLSSVLKGLLASREKINTMRRSYDVFSKSDANVLLAGVLA